MNRTNIILHKKNYILQLCLFIIASFFYGCFEETPVENGTGTDGYFQFRIMTPDATPPKTLLKSGQTEAETAISEIQVLVFENGNYLYRVTGNGITNSGSNSTTFQARLLSSDEPTTIYIIANATSDIEANEPQVGEDIATVKGRLTKAISTTPIGGNLTMWGSHEFPSGLSATTENNIDDIRMLRSVARVDIIATNASSNFQMVSVQAFRAANNMQLIPDNPTATPSVTTPSIPSGTAYNINTDVITSSSTSSVAQLYLPESATPPSGDFVNDATCVIIGGYYAGSTTITYYRLDFNPNIDGHPLGQILRNHRYEFNINYVQGAGYLTAQEAADNISSSMDVQIVLWQDYIKHMVFDLNNFLGVSSSYITLQGDANSSYTILVDTDIPDYTISWADRDGVPEGEESASLSDEFFEVDRSPDGSTIFVNATQENPEGSDYRTRYILLRGKALKLFITIIQQELDFTPEPGPGGVIWAETNVDLPYTFANQTEIGKFYQWNRDEAWASTGTVTGWNSTGATGSFWEAANNPCPPGWRVPTRDELQALINSTGRSWRIVSTEYNYPGVWFAPTQEEANEATFEDPGNGLFFPAGGVRNESGDLESAGSNSHYWASDVNPLGGSTDIMSIANGTYFIFPVSRASGCLIRCVHD